METINEYELLDNQYLISYSDRDGNITQRTIDIKDINGDYIKAFCHLKNKPRTFRKDRIIGMYDATTGESIKVDFIHNYTKSKNERIGEIFFGLILIIILVAIFL